MSESLANPAGLPDPSAGHAGDDGSIARALLWVVLGAAAAVAAFVAMTPELADADGGRPFEPLGIVLVAAVPGLVLLGLAAFRRARLGLDDDEED
jgi:hypothetical protein